MITVLKKGYKEQVFYQVECFHCHCEFECEREDLGDIECLDQRDGTRGKIKCPCCNTLLTVNMDYCYKRKVREEL